MKSAPSSRPRSRKARGWLLAGLIVLFGGGLALYAAAQSGSASQMSLNSPLSFPVDI
ncbi:hypothetical protein ACTL6U_10895 [Rhodovibrionaceae bacterium A322]